MFSKIYVCQYICCFGKLWIPYRFQICEGLSVRQGLEQSAGFRGLNYLFLWRLYLIWAKAFALRLWKRVSRSRSFSSYCVCVPCGLELAPAQCFSHRRGERSLKWSCDQLIEVWLTQLRVVLYWISPISLPLRWDVTPSGAWDQRDRLRPITGHTMSVSKDIHIIVALDSVLLSSQYAVIYVDCSYISLIISVIGFVSFAVLQKYLFSKGCSSIPQIITALKQLTKKPLLCVINICDPYQGRRDPLSFSYYVNKHYRLHISWSIIWEQCELSEAGCLSLNTLHLIVLLAFA